MAVEIDALGAHVGGGRLFGQPDQFGRGVLESRGQHIVGIVAKTGMAQGDVRGVVANGLAPAAQLLHPDVSDSSRGRRYMGKERMSARVAIEWTRRAAINSSSVRVEWPMV